MLGGEVTHKKRESLARASLGGGRKEILNNLPLLFPLCHFGFFLSFCRRFFLSSDLCNVNAKAASSKAVRALRTSSPLSRQL